jgi:hypothetical protein
MGTMTPTEDGASVPDPAVVQRSLLASASPEQNNTWPRRPPSRERRDVIIALRLTRFLVERVEAYQARYRKRARTDAINELLELGIFIMENVERLDDPALVKYFQENLYNVQMVDHVMDWPQNRIEAIIGVLASERDRRIRLKIGRL